MDSHPRDVLAPLFPMNLLGFDFEGPFSIDGSFNDVPGIYVILAPTHNKVVDVGQTDKLGQRIPNHDRKPGWRRCGGNQLWFHRDTSVLSRLGKESRLRTTYAPLCGVR